MQITQRNKSTLDNLLRAADKSQPPSGSVRRKLIRWVNGVPLPVDSEIIIDNKETVKSIIRAAAALPYGSDDDPLGLYPELFGYSKLEVAMIKLMRQAAKGDLDAIKIVLDRLMGKPEQLSQSVAVTGTYKDFLETLKNKEENGSEVIIDTSALG